MRARLVAVLTAADVPFNGYGIYPDVKDQPVLADGLVRYRGEAVLALVGRAQVRDRDERCRSPGRPSRRSTASTAATAPDAPLVQADKPKTCCSRRRKRGTLDAFAGCAAVAEGAFETAFVEHAYIEPEAGWARRVGDRIEIHATTQTP